MTVKERKKFERKQAYWIDINGESDCPLEEPKIVSPKVKKS
jgi:DNA mismatch repair protein MutH